jgi:hypothetical protein
VKAARTAILAGLAVVTAARPAAACAVCALEDPTLSAAGSEAPFRGRLRADVDVLAGWVEEGAADGRWLRVDDARVAATLAYAPSRDLLLSAVVPVLDRTLHDGRTMTSEGVLGDVEARAYAMLWRGDGPRQLALVGGLKAPTAPVERDARGVALPAELEPGCSAIVPYLGLAYAAGGRWVTGQASAALYLPFAVRDAPHAGDSFHAAAWMQVQAVPWLATRLGLRAQVDSTGELAPGVADLNSGGFLGYVTTDAIASPWSDVVLSVGASFPVVQALLGEHRESTVASAQVAYDF